MVDLFNERTMIARYINIWAVRKKKELQKSPLVSPLYLYKYHYPGNDKDGYLWHNGVFQ